MEQNMAKYFMTGLMWVARGLISQCCSLFYANPMSKRIYYIFWKNLRSFSVLWEGASTLEQLILTLLCHLSASETRYLGCRCPAGKAFPSEEELLTSREVVELPPALHEQGTQWSLLGRPSPSGLPEPLLCRDGNTVCAQLALPSQNASHGLFCTESICSRE